MAMLNSQMVLLRANVGLLDGLLRGCWDDDITSDEMDHSQKFPA